MSVTVSHSEVEAFLSCERKHFYGYTMELEPKEKNDNLVRGGMGHGALEVLYNAVKDGASINDAYKDAKQFLVPRIAENPVIAAQVLELLQFHVQVNPFKYHKILAVESDYTAPIITDPEEVDYAFVVDLITQRPDGKTVIWDHKFTYDFYRADQIELLPQLPKYRAALAKLGFKADLVGYNLLRWRKLKDPTPEAKNMIIEWEPSAVRQHRTFVEQAEATRRVTTIKSQSPQQRSSEALRVGSKTICDYCDFKALCSAELNDTNPQLVLRSQYKKRERRVFNEVD